MSKENALLCHAHIQLSTAAHVKCVMDVTSMDATVRVGSNLHTLQIAVSAAPVRYCHASFSALSTVTFNIHRKIRNQKL